MTEHFKFVGLKLHFWGMGKNSLISPEEMPNSSPQRAGLSVRFRSNDCQTPKTGRHRQTRLRKQVQLLLSGRFQIANPSSEGRILLCFLSRYELGQNKFKDVVTSSDKS